MDKGNYKKSMSCMIHEAAIEGEVRSEYSIMVERFLLKLKFEMDLNVTNGHIERVFKNHHLSIKLELDTLHLANESKDVYISVLKPSIDWLIGFLIHNGLTRE